MPVYQDMMGQEVALTGPPKRIVSLVPSQTELLHALGLEEEVVGITKFCIHPERWFRSKERVGGTKTVNRARIAALQPDLILANKEENVQEQIEALSNSAPVWTSDIKTLEDALHMIQEIGKLCDKEAKAQEIIQEIRQGFATLHTPPHTPQKVAYAIWRNPWMWAGQDTFITDMLRRAGWQNALEGFSRYPELSPEALRSYAPELILLSSEPYPFREKHLDEIKSILPDTKVILVDGELFSWYGSRLLRTPAYLQSLMHTLYG